MLSAIVDYAVPAALFVLMLIAGTDVSAADFKLALRRPRAILAGAVGQLLLLPPLALVIVTTTGPTTDIATAAFVLAVCPGGAISNSYCYVGGLDVSLSASITAVATVLSIVTMPLWLDFGFGFLGLAGDLSGMSGTRIVLQLLLFMALPLLLGMALRARFKEVLEPYGRTFRLFSIGILAAILLATIWVERGVLSDVLVQALVFGVCFVFSAMLLGQALSIGLGARDGPVLVVEASVRNVGVAILIASFIFSGPQFVVFVAFMSGYVAVEIVMILAYVYWIRTRVP